MNFNLHIITKDIGKLKLIKNHKNSNLDGQHNGRKSADHIWHVISAAVGPFLACVSVITSFSKARREERERKEENAHHALRRKMLNMDSRRVSRTFFSPPIPSIYINHKGKRKKKRNDQSRDQRPVFTFSPLLKKPIFIIITHTHRWPRESVSFRNYKSRTDKRNLVFLFFPSRVK